jgi:hypothetical protein
VGQILGDQHIKDPRHLLNLIDVTLQQADTYDSQLFETMGVKTIWVTAFTEIRQLLDEITEPVTS